MWNHGMSDHLLHQGPVRVSFAIYPRIEGLHKRESARSTQNPHDGKRQGASRVDRTGAVGSEKFVVSHVEHEKIRRKSQRVTNLIDQGETGDSSGAQIDDLEIAVGLAVVRISRRNDAMERFAAADIPWRRTLRQEISSRFPAVWASGNWSAPHNPGGLDWHRNRASTPPARQCRRFLLRATSPLHAKMPDTHPARNTA